MRYTVSKEELRALKILHRALVTGLLLILIAILYLAGIPDLTNINSGPMLHLIIGILLAVICVFFAQFFFSRKMNELTGDPTSPESSEQIRVAYTLKWMLIEGAALINVVLFYHAYLFHHVSNPVLIIVALILVVVLVLAGPQLDGGE